MLDFRTAYYFPWTMIIISPFLVLFGGVLIVEQIYLGVLLVVTTLLFLTTHYRFKIDEKRKEYREYLWILGFKHGKTIAYEKVISLYFTKSRMKQTINSRVSSMTVSNEVYNGFIQFDGDKKVHLFTKGKKQKLVDCLISISKFLKTEVKDLSGS
jgi:hypothetical protein